MGFFSYYVSRIRIFFLLVPASSDSSVTFVGVHIRRADYGEHLEFLYGKSYVQGDYFRTATNYFRHKFQVTTTRIIIITYCCQRAR